MKDARGRSHVPDRFIAFDGNGKAKDGSGLVFDDYRNWLLVQSWVRDRRAGLSHIFVSRPLRARLLALWPQDQGVQPATPMKSPGLLKQPENSLPRTTITSTYEFRVHGGSLGSATSNRSRSVNGRSGRATMA